MKQKRKNNEIPFSEMPIDSRRFSILTLLGVILAVGVILGICYITASVIYLTSFRYEVFVRGNTPLIQETIEHQCNIPEYTVEGYFDDSTLRDYFHRTGNLRIDCHLESDDNWQCTCTENN